MLTDSQHDHLEYLLNGLGTVKPLLPRRSAEFVDQITEAFSEFNWHTRLSQKQMDWLESLYTQHVGPLD
jgi:hypothetical protein